MGKEQQVEKIIQDCKDMASETTFNLEGGFGKTIDNKRYANLLEGLVRAYLPKIDLKKP